MLKNKGTQPMSLMRLVYASRPFGFDDLALSGILATARRNNARDGVTGALICREDIYLQWLEGPGDLVIAAYARITRDDRHTDVSLKFQEEAASRLFPDWAMRHDPALSWLWSREEIFSGAADRASADDVRQVFSRLAQEPTSSPSGKCPMSAAE
jgi:hypothetical protein